MGHRHAPVSLGVGRRVFAVAAVLLVFGALVGVTPDSRAESARRAPACDPPSSPSPTATGSDGTGDGGTAANAATPSASPPTCAEPDGGEETPGDPGGAAPGGGLDPLGDDCTNSKLPAHTGFQEGGRCVSTAFGEVGAAERNPTLLITEAPERVRAGQPFRLVVSTRNLVRDRFLPAGQGGYYLERSFLTDEGLVRGHFHTACRMLTSTSEAADPAPVPAFFVATEDGKGGSEPDRVIIEVPGLPAGLAQCSAWAGDGSHRIPMMARANQIPALDSVRIQVEPGAEEPPADDPGGDQPPTGQPGDDEPPTDQPGDGDQPPTGQPGDGSPGQEPGGEERPGSGQGSDGQEPDPERSGGATATPTPTRREPSPAGPTTAGGTTEASGSGGGLALTGTNTIAFFGLGGALLIGGVALLYLSRRRTVRR
ncbi:hypothetical protein [Micromonospora sp. HM5-17]|uniref:hypothetical protein n=1 Tax=Micromonospora sp. HM5-17 TaxID=2487710 RepID=UPI001F2225A3|nr:hypothetical protein [Micromonospora sp. HM5-17]